jgi:hypothetical protein
MLTGIRTQECPGTPLELPSRSSFAVSLASKSFPGAHRAILTVAQMLPKRCSNTCRCSAVSVPVAMYTICKVTGHSPGQNGVLSRDVCGDVHVVTGNSCYDPSTDISCSVLYNVNGSIESAGKGGCCMVCEAGLHPLQHCGLASD